MSVTSSEPFQFQCLPDDVLQRILRFVIDPTLKDVPFLPSRVVRYATVCSKWKRFVYPLIRVMNTYDLMYDVRKSVSFWNRQKSIEAVFYFGKKFSNSIRRIGVEEYFDNICMDGSPPPPNISDEQLGELLTLPARLEALSLNLKANHSGIETTIALSVRTLPALRAFELID